MADINIRLPDFGQMVQDVTAEFQTRVERRTPRSNLNKDHLQDQWEIQQVGEEHARIVNETEYASFVEEGTSKMSGHFMVRTTMDEVPDMIEEALKKQGF